MGVDDRQSELEDRVRHVAINSGTDYPEPSELVRNDKLEYDLIEYLFDEDDEYLSGEQAVRGTGPLRDMLVELLQTFPGESLELGGLTAIEAVELLNLHPYRGCLTEVPALDGTDAWDTLELPSVNGERVGMVLGTLSLPDPD